MKQVTKRKIDTRKLIKKISLAAILLALCVIFMKFLPFQLPILPYARISLGPSLIMLSSILLGPLWGMIIGAGADLIGFLFDATGYGFFPGITVMYALLGLVTGLIFQALKRVNNKNNLILVFVGLLLGILIVTFANIIRMDTVTLGLVDYEFGVVLKVIIISVISLLAIGMVAAIILFQKKINKGKKDLSVLQTSITALIVEILIITFFGAFVKSIHFGMNFNIIVFTQLILLFINVPLNVAVVTTIYNLFKERV